MRRFVPVLCVLVLLGACGGSGDKAAVTTTTVKRTTTTTTAPTPEEQLAAVFTGTKGFDLVPLPPNVEADARKQFDSDPDLKAAVTAVALRSATTADQPQGLILLMAVDERYSSSIGFKQGILDDMKKDAASPPEDLKVSGRDVTYVEDKDGTKVMVYVGRRVVVFVFGEERSKIEAVTTAVLAATPR